MVVDRPSVQAVILDADKGKVLLIRKHNSVRDELVWRLVKGGVAEGETDPEAMKREIAEEVGLRGVRILDKIYYYEFQYMNLRHLVSVYLVEADMNEAVTLQGETEEESAIVDHAWLPPEEARETLYWEHEKRSVTAATVSLRNRKKK
jgi:ADP-ribose pyrophosphatase YjhB (NUDIX family)